jgi:TPR repeat protein
MVGVKKLIEEARRGNAEAQYQLAAIYATGDGIDLDLSKAFEWYSKAGLQKHPEALYNLGWMHLRGEATQRDAARGISYMAEAVAAGSKDAPELLGDAYSKGLFDLDQDPILACCYYTKAVVAGNSRAMLSLAIALDTNMVSSNALIEALLRLAAEASVKQAAQILADR